MEDGQTRSSAHLSKTKSVNHPDFVILAICTFLSSFVIIMSNIQHDNTNGGSGGDGGTDDLSNKIEEIMLLMDQRARGEASTEQVEEAVSSILGKLGAAPPPKKKARTRTRASKSTKAAAAASSSLATIQVDQGNYDDEDDSNENDKNTAKIKNDNDNNHQQEDMNHQESKELPSSSLSSSTVDAMKLSTAYDDNTNTISMEDYQELLKEIPMGKVGSQMMTAFGDGSCPNIEALKLALEGTRRALQYIVMDARALRRRIKLQYSQAQLETLAGKKNIAGPTTISTSAIAAANGGLTDPTTTRSANTNHNATTTTTTTTDATLVFRALLTDQSASHDPLGRHPPCGFDFEQLARLYPEEIQAYDRWNELHEEYEHPNSDEEGEDKPQVPRTSDGTTPLATDEADQVQQEQDYLGGHLKERVAVFNIRTDHMPKDMYLHFSRIRQGSFLPRGRGRQSTKLEKEWNSIEIRRGRGRGGTWLHMPAITVRFLHWLGFQPPEVPPPDAETTQVLAFLGHDRMGRIVEKAIQLRNFKEGKDALEFRELPPWEQLTVQDIQAALDDPDVKPAPLFPFDDDQDGMRLPNVQLYFGPGFEQRLELEMEEYVITELIYAVGCWLGNLFVLDYK